MVPFEVFWGRLKEKLMTGSKQNNEWRWQIPKWSRAYIVTGVLLCVYRGDDEVSCKTGNERFVTVDKTEFEKLYSCWEAYREDLLARSQLEHELRLRRTSYTIPILKYFETLMD